MTPRRRSHTMKRLCSPTMERAGNKGNSTRTRNASGKLERLRPLAAVGEKLVKGRLCGGFEGEAASPLRTVSQPCMRPAGSPHFPKLTAEWEKQPDPDNRGRADPDAHLWVEVSRKMAKGGVKSYPFAPTRKTRNSSRNAAGSGKCPAAAPRSMRGKRALCAATRNVPLPCGRTTVSLRRKGKVNFSPKIAAALLKGQQGSREKLYSPENRKRPMGEQDHF